MALAAARHAVEDLTEVQVTEGARFRTIHTRARSGSLVEHAAKASPGSPAFGDRSAIRGKRRATSREMNCCHQLPPNSFAVEAISRPRQFRRASSPALDPSALPQSALAPRLEPPAALMTPAAGDVHADGRHRCHLQRRDPRGIDTGLVGWYDGWLPLGIWVNAAATVTDSHSPGAGSNVSSLHMRRLDTCTKVLPRGSLGESRLRHRGAHDRRPMVTLTARVGVASACMLDSAALSRGEMTADATGLQRRLPRGKRPRAE